MSAASAAPAPTRARERIDDELDLMRRLLPLAGAHVVDLGCGQAEMARRLVQGALVAGVDALEVDRGQHARNLASPHPEALRFVAGGADDIPFSPASFDIALMLKSLHHVPLARLDRALDEVARVLVPGGLLYVSEPVFAGEFNEVMRVFHDEERARAEALAALHRAAARGVLEPVAESFFDAPLAFRDFDDFLDRMVRVSHTAHSPEAAALAEVRRRFDRHCGASGARFERPMRVNLLRRPA